MRNKRWMLVRTLLNASASRNIIKYEKDKKKRKKVIGGIVGNVILYIFLAAVLILLTIGMNAFGMIDGVPVICALIVSGVELVFGILRSGDYLFSHKDYEILAALPFTVRDLVSAKFIAMYIRNLITAAVCSLSMMVGYGIGKTPAFYVYIIWIVLTVFLPLIPTVIGSLIGTLSAGAGAGSKHKSVIQSVFIFIFTIAFIFLGQIAGRLFSSGEEVGAALTTISGIGETAGRIYLPLRWFSDAVLKADPLSILLLIAVSVIIFELVFLLISKAYRRICTRMKSVRKESRPFIFGKQKTRSAVRSLAYKEYRHFIGSSVYLTNTGVGAIIVLILSVLVLVFDVNRLFSLVVRGAPFAADIMIPVVPMILFFFIGMVPTTVVSWSLEGKNFWILQSLPLTKLQICKGKMLFNLYTSVPFMIIGCICFGIALHVPVPIIILSIVCGIVLCLFSTVFGMYCNLKHANMDWDREIEAVKRGSAVSFYLLPNLFITMAVIGICAYYGFYNGAVKVLWLITIVYAGVAALFYWRVRKTANS